MTGKARTAIGLIIIGAGILLIHPQQDPPQTAKPPTQPAITTRPDAPLTPVSEADRSKTPSPATAQPQTDHAGNAALAKRPVNSPGSPEELERTLERVRFALRDFRTAVGENPVGTNAEITRSLLGDNLKQVKVPVPDGSTLNADGELCDPWGTPYFFHQISGKEMEVRSAGADKRMWTDDDRMEK